MDQLRLICQGSSECRQVVLGVLGVRLVKLQLRSHKPSSNDVEALILTVAATGDRKLLRWQSTWEPHGARQSRTGLRIRWHWQEERVVSCIHPKPLPRDPEKCRMTQMDTGISAGIPSVLSTQGATGLHCPGWIAPLENE